MSDWHGAVTAPILRSAVKIHKRCMQTLGTECILQTATSVDGAHEACLKDVYSHSTDSQASYTKLETASSVAALHHKSTMHSIRDEITPTRSHVTPTTRSPLSQVKQLRVVSKPGASSRIRATPHTRDVGTRLTSTRLVSYAHRNTDWLPLGMIVLRFLVFNWHMLQVQSLQPLLGASMSWAVNRYAVFELSLDS